MTIAEALVAVFCRNLSCPFLRAKGKPLMVGKLTHAGELRCPSCRTVAEYSVAAIT